MFDNTSSDTPSAMMLTVADLICRGVRFLGIAFIGLSIYSAIKTIVNTTKLLAGYGPEVFNGPLLAMLRVALLHIFFVAVGLRFAKRLFRMADRGRHMTAIVRRGIRGQDVIPAMNATPVALVDDRFATYIREHFGSQPGFFDRSHPVWHGTSCLCSRCMATPDTG